MQIKRKPLGLAVALALIGFAGWVGNIVNVVQLPSNLSVITQTVRPVIIRLGPYLSTVQIVVILGVIALVVYGLDLHTQSFRLYQRARATSQDDSPAAERTQSIIPAPIADKAALATEANALGARIFALTATYQPQMPVTHPNFQTLNDGIRAENAAAEKAVVAKYLSGLSGEVRRIGERAKAQGLLGEDDAWMISQRPVAVKAIEEFGAILFRIGIQFPESANRQINMHQAYNLICKLRRLDSATDPIGDKRAKVFPEIRQAARDGRLVVRGCPIPKGMHDSRSPQENIPAEHWRHYDFEETTYITDDDERNIRFASTSIDYANRLTIDRYNNLSVNERDVYRLFSSAP